MPTRILRDLGSLSARVCVLIAAILAPDAANAWPQFRGPERDGKAGDGPPLLASWPDGGPPLVWTFDRLGEGYSSAAIGPDAIFLTGMEGETGYLYALDREGQLLWRSPYGPEWSRNYRGSRTTPTVHNGRIYLLSGFGRAVCFDAATGRELWAVDTMAAFGARNLTWGITESPLALDDKVIFSPGGPNAGVVALHPDTGATVWVCAEVNDLSGYCSPILVEWGGRRIIAQLMGATFIGIEADTGRLLWREPRRPAPAHNIQAVSPVFAEGRFYLTSGYGGQRGALYRLDASGAGVTRVWQESNLDCQLGGLILRQGFVYGASDRNHRGQWLCLDLEDGTVAAMTPGVGKGSVAFADGLLYTLSERGVMGLVRADPGDFRLISSFRVPSGGPGPHWAHPSISGGRLYIRHASSLFVYGISAD